MSEPYRIPRATLIPHLAKLGWLQVKDLARAIAELTEWELVEAVVGFQKFHGLTVSGHPGAEVANALASRRICKHPDVWEMQAGDSMCKWPQKDLTWWVDPAAHFGTLGAGEIKDAFAWAWGQWCAVCGLTAVYTPNQKTASIYVTTGDIDGPWGILAWSQPPDNSGTQRHQFFDQGEAWVYSPAPTKFQLDLGRVACHEIGHAVGLPHLPAGNLLQPIYDLHIRGPQAGDIAEVQARYGPPVEAPPAPALISGGKSRLVVEFSGDIIGVTIPGFQVVKA